MIHKVPEEWLIKLETTLRTATKKGRISNRLEEILAETSRVCELAFKKQDVDTPIKIKPKFWNKLKNKLAIKGGK